MTHEELVRSQRLFLVLTVVTLVLASGFAYLQFSEWLRLRAETSKMAKEVGDPEQLRRRVSELRNSTVSSRLAVAHLELNLPTRDYVPTMLRELEAMGGASGLRITGVRPVPKKEKPKPTTEDAEAPGKPSEATEKKPQRKPYEEMDFEIEAIGRYADILQFLEKVSGFPKIIAVKSVSVATVPNPRDTGPPELKATFGVRAFIFPSRPERLVRSGPASSEEVGSGG